ncbi:MAG TPA: BamA/TamA family outer membrane protein [Candidatus Krumholzibacteria bacterium]|nr:BamA/TamA family outer membrane protein [Candidatus Krumholzibacteria bacterium]
MRRVGLLLLALLLPVAALARNAAPDSAAWDPADAPAWTLRGTQAPLDVRRGGAPWLVRQVAEVPATAFRLVTAPPVALIRWDERSGFSRRVAGFFTRDVAPINTTVAAYLGYETGFGMTVLGLRVHSTDWYGTGLDNRFRFSYLNTRKNIVQLEFGAPPGAPAWSTRTRFQRSPGRHYYPAADADDDQEYDFQLLLNEAQLRLPLQGPLDAALTLHSRATRLRPEHDDDPDERLAPALAERAASNHYLGVEAELRRDSRDAGEMASRGSLLRAAAGWNAARAPGDADYRHLTFEYQLHRPLFRDRILAARVFFEAVDPDDAARLPFTELRALGGRYDLRGYPRDRFRDLHLLALALEYRYPVTKMFQGRLFADWGAAAPRARDLDLAELHASAGLGLALLLDDDVFVLQYARGAEGGHVFAGTTTPFGYQSRRKR